MELNVHNTFGALQIGISFAILLFGVLCVQTFHYYFAFPDDRPSFHTLVAIVWLLDLGHTIAITYEIYTITTLCSPGGTVAFPGLGAALLIGGIITTLVQIFFARRLWKLLPQPYNYIGIICVILALTRCGGSTFLASRAITTKDISLFRLEWDWLITALLSVGAGLDVAIAAAMIYFLLQQRENVMHRLIDRLVAYTIRTGLFTSIAAVVVVISFKVMPENYDL
ncbi:hypothetical protein FA15DRAFT_672978 [Coprinopsis marcescibilis]|uniref:DUF6534 domain-containing protein n=1 Tax=Coprinopsis marcescibilis TaxID=230819 RepID=A0A5C3KLZ6_COPMA|nr:hypothetical protein FA15DRAFT_672978 [Coprinopsis marcescibilis]